MRTKFPTTARTTAQTALWMAACLAAVGLLTTVGWAQHLVMAPSKVTPAASIRLNLGTDDNGNTTVDLNAEHLAPASSLSPPKTAYMVWVQAENQPPEREGELDVNSDLKGELKFVTPAKRFQIIITAEDNAQASTPSGTEIVRSAVARAKSS